MGYFLGIDTSCYTTSIAIMDTDGTLIADERKMLTVKKGGRGLRQSEMVFAHVKNLPELFEKACRSVPKESGCLQAVGVSAYPRSLPDSYMPVFTVGEAFARSVAATGNFPMRRLSHQEGHILAGIWSVGHWTSREFLAVHLSGGTTEIVRARLDLTDAGARFDLAIIGGSADIHAGQFIDRIGVKLGLAFPCGAEMEKLAKTNNDTPVKIPVAVNGLQVSFAGPETFAARLIDAKTASPQTTAAGVQLAVAESLRRLLKNAVGQTGLTDVLLVGGVASNQFIRRYLADNLPDKDVNVKLCFPEPRYSPDNAVGAAYAALLAGGISNLVFDPKGSGVLK